MNYYIYAFKSTIKNIILDFRQPVGYLIPAAGVLLLVWLCLLGIGRIRRKQGVINMWHILLIIYGVVLLQTAFFSREPGSRGGIDLEIFGTWGSTPVAHAYFIENILMFLPFGILLPVCVRRFRKGWFCTLCGCLCSVFLELSQLATGRGYCQIDDVLTNTAGAFAGWCIWYVLAGMLRMRNSHGMYCIKCNKKRQ